ncbi:helix-turn-helix transcriptional regulator [Streptomyces brasiliensis]|uniref:Transcriptional regulator n=1 Tax=Streptomyces brasiliensis TaxID=1954 RepID=A0A917P169_9ACTN|nr:LuxR family transcriptional regulator [Streptomyces brasiliensis]GGJ49401.1 transcriptional regulator [Streptomyces brasiliensis]
MDEWLFEREDALGVVRDLMDRGGSVVTVGDPGVGKSSLLKAAAQLARRQGRRVLSVAPTQFEQGLPFAGLAELVGRFPEGADKGLPGPQRRALAVALQRAEPTEGEVDALAVPMAVRGLLTQLCESELVALLIDDLQWLDQASVGSLGFALRGVFAEPHRLSVLVATRPDPVTGTDLIRCLAEPRHEFVLRPLSDEALGQLLRTRLGPEWTPPVSAGVARASGGNPFLALEIARASDHGRVQVPPSLAELLRERLARLTEDAREVLLLASAAGRLTVAQVQRIVEQARLWPALEAAADADVATVGAGSVIGFSHPLLASAVYDAATSAERRRAHRVLAETLEDPVERARHRSRSIAAPNEVVAADLERAAELSRGRGAPQLAGELLEGAALATPSDEDAGLGRWLRAVDTYSEAGDAVAARAALCKGSGLATAPEQQAQVLVRRIRLAQDLPTARSLAEQVLQLAPTGSEARAEAMGTFASICRIQGDGTRALELARTAVTEAAAVQRPDLQLTALIERVSVERHWGAGVDLAQQSSRDIEQLARTAQLPVPYLAFTRSFNAPWDDPTAEKHVRDAIEWAVDAGRYGELPKLYSSLILVLMRKSKVREARAALDEAARSGAWAPADRDWAYKSQSDMVQIIVTAYAGDLDVTREWARRAADRPQIQGSTYWRGGFLAQLGFVETSARNWQAALETLRELAEIFASTGMVDLEAQLWGVDYADAALQVGATEDVEAAISILRRQGSAGRPEAAVAADRCQALLTAARGDVDDALSELLRIVDQPGSECPFEAARSQLALGQVYRRAGYKGKANQTLKAAVDAFEELGIPRWAQRARDEAGRVGLYPTTDTLTATERRVAELVASGRSNQETAAELFMSVKTVEANLTRIYRKLSIRSRTELANRLNTAT